MGRISISIKNLSVKFGTHLALHDINLEIPQSLFVTIVGPNGAGKSTLLKVILGITNPDKGEVLIDGKSPDKLKPSEIGYVPQIKTLDRSFPALPVELVASGLKTTWPGILSKELKKKSMEALESVGASHLAKRTLSKLSGGELQRIYLARSLVRRPKFLLLDEPATGIDMASEKDLNKLIDDYHNESKATIILITHDWEAAYHHSDLVILMNREIICFDKPETAFNEDNLRKVFGHIGHAHEMIFGVKH